MCIVLRSIYANHINYIVMIIILYDVIFITCMKLYLFIAYHIVLHYDWYDMIWYDMIWYDMIWYDIIWYHMISYHIISYHIISYQIRSCRIVVKFRCSSSVCSSSVRTCCSRWRCSWASTWLTVARWLGWSAPRPSSVNSSPTFNSRNSSATAKLWKVTWLTTARGTGAVMTSYWRL